LALDSYTELPAFITPTGPMKLATTRWPMTSLERLENTPDQAAQRLFEPR
jgi:hypothetical protein